jgi:hypothetical protein
MPVQDLTPQLRTRLSRVERTVGWFVMFATVLLLVGFAYYVYHTALRKGWFLTKLPYHTFVQSAAGLHVGDQVMLMGFEVGQITRITAMPPFSNYGNVYVEFIIKEPFYGYIWTDSYVKVVSAGFLGNRTLEVVQGGTSTNKNLHPSYDTTKEGKVLAVWDNKDKKFVPFGPTSKGYSFEPAVEAPIVTDRLEELANQAQKALPGIFDLTNQITHVLTNVAQLSTHADDVILQTQPLLSHLTQMTSSLTNGKGSLGEWIIPTNLNAQLETTLASADSTLVSANTNLTKVALGLDATLINLANITSNLNAQVQRNDQLVSSISETIVHADEFVQGLKRHWLLRSAFKNENKPPPPKQGPPPRRPLTEPAEPKTGKRE